MRSLLTQSRSDLLRFPMAPHALQKVCMQRVLYKCFEVPMCTCPSLGFFLSVCPVYYFETSNPPRGKAELPQKSTCRSQFPFIPHAPDDDVCQHPERQRSHQMTRMFDHTRVWTGVSGIDFSIIVCMVWDELIQCLILHLQHAFLLLMDTFSAIF